MRMSKNNDKLTEGILSSMLGRMLLFLSGAGKEYKQVKKQLNDPEFKKRWNNMHQRVADLTKDYQQLIDDSKN